MDDIEDAVPQLTPYSEMLAGFTKNGKTILSAVLLAVVVAGHALTGSTNNKSSPQSVKPSVDKIATSSPSLKQ